MRKASLFSPSSTSALLGEATAQPETPQKPLKPSGGAVGFLDLIDESEAAQVVAARLEEDAWVDKAVLALPADTALLETVTLCMNLNPDSWRYYVVSLLLVSQAANQVDLLLRFWVEAEVAAPHRETGLFREDSVRVMGLQQYLLVQVHEWFAQNVYRSHLRKVLTSGARAAKLDADAVALDVLRSLNANVATLPLGVQQTLEKLSAGVHKRFGQRTPAECNLLACVFLFLHVVTPCIVNPAGYGFATQESRDREVIYFLARVGKVVQTWINNACQFDAGLTSSDSMHSLDEDDSDLSLNSDRSFESATSGASSARRSQAGSDGPTEVLNFARAVFSATGPVLPDQPLSDQALQDARAVLRGVIKKNYQLLRDLEQASDRSAAAAKHLGALQAKLFGSATLSDVTSSSSSFVVPEALTVTALNAEALVGAFLADLKRSPNGGEQYIGAERFVLLRASALSVVLPSLRSVNEAGVLMPLMTYSVWREMGLFNAKALMRNSKPMDWKTATLAVFPYLAFSGRGRSLVASSSELVQTSTLLISVKMENSLETVSHVASKEKEVRCFGMCGFLAGWCSHTIGKEVQAAEISCVGKGDKACLFVIAPDPLIGSHARRLSSELKLPLSSRSNGMLESLSTWLRAEDAPGDAGKVPGRKSSTEPMPPIPEDGLDFGLAGMGFRVRTPKKGVTVVSGPMFSLTETHAAVQALLARDAHAKVARAVPKPSGGSGTPSGRRTTGGSATLPVLTEVGLAEFRKPISMVTKGELMLAGQRYALFAGTDWTHSVHNATQRMLRRTLVPCLNCTQYNLRSASKCKACATTLTHKRDVAVTNGDIKTAVKIASTFLYISGVANGEALADHVLPTPRSNLSYQTQFDLLTASTSNAGLGNMTLSPLSETNPDGDYFFVFARVTESFEARDRLGSSLNKIGAPTCSLLAGTIAGWASRVVGARCVCVEIECAGCGSASVVGQCVFLCAFPTAIVATVKIAMAAAQKEALLTAIQSAIELEQLAGSTEAPEQAEETTPSKPKFSFGRSSKGK